MKNPQCHPRIKLLTCETWVTRASWHDYAIANPSLVPHLLVDRSICQEPFLDQFAPPGETPRPLISGLCRKLKNFSLGDIFIYITRVDPALFSTLGIPAGSGPSCYFPVAALQVKHVHSSHLKAARTFTPRRYVSAPLITPYPPNLAHNPTPRAAADAGASAVFRTSSSRAVRLGGKCGQRVLSIQSQLIWTKNSNAAYLANYRHYHARQKTSTLRAAECCLLAPAPLNPPTASIFPTQIAGWRPLNIHGRILSAGEAKTILKKFFCCDLPGNALGVCSEHAAS
jgi:hypothetical protein